MGVIAVTRACGGYEHVTLDRLSETQWLRRDGSALVTTSMLFTFAVEQEEAADAPAFVLYVPYRLENPTDSSHNWLAPDYLDYYSNTSGDYYRRQGGDEREIVDGLGPIFVNELELTATETVLLGPARGGTRYFTRQRIRLLHHPAGGRTRHMIQLKYIARDVARRRTRVPALTGPNWCFANRYYSVYDIWDSKAREAAEAIDDEALVPVGEIDNWIAFPGATRVARLAPTPELESVVLVEHPGYMPGVNPIRAQTICRFRLDFRETRNPWVCGYTFGEFEDQPIPLWVAYVAIIATVLGILLTVILA